MSRLAALVGVLLAALLATMTPTPAGAETADKLANMTFSGPVQVPGAMLNAGTYRFRLANPDSSRNIMQVLSHDGSTVYAMFYTMPDWRSEVADEATVIFKETAKGVPPVIKTFFYGGESAGYEFAYWGETPVTTPTVRPQPPITYTPMPAVASPAPAAEPVAAPAAPAPAIEPAPVTAEPAAPAETPAAVPEALPTTATPLPLVALSGLSSLALGLGVALFRRRDV